MAGNYLAQFLLTFFVLAGVVAFASVLFVGVVWWSGGLHTGGKYLDWGAVASVAALASVLATVGAVAALRFAVTELETQTRDERISSKPYLRIDVGFRERMAQSHGFQAPSSWPFFTPSDFNITDRVAELQPIRPVPPHAPSFGLALWVSNKQTAALGAAYSVKVEVLVGWPNGDEPVAAPLTVEFAYVEPGKTTAIEIARVRRDIGWLAVSVESVEYEDIFTPRALVDHHGALEMFYDQAAGVTWNERKFRLGKKREA